MEEVIRAEDCGEKIGDYDIPIHNAIIIPRGATNGDVIKAMFPSSEVREIMDDDDLVHYTLDGYVGAYTPKDWWNAPYRKVNKDADNN